MTPVEEEALLTQLEDAIARASRLGTALVIARAETSAVPPEPLELFARAEELGETRFAASGSGVTRIGVGEAAVLRAAASGPDPASGIAGLAADLRSTLRGAEVAPHADLRLFGGFAFDPRSGGAGDPAWAAFGAGRLMLPEWTLVADSTGTRLSWAARIGPSDDAHALARRIGQRRARLLSPAAPCSAAPRLAPPPDALSARFAAAARELIEAIRAGAARKVVLADCETLGVEGRLDARVALGALRTAHPDCLVFAQGLGDATFLGATPERMLALSEGRVRASALAGTAPLGRDLRGSLKDREEHAFVVDAIACALRATCDDVEVPAEPDLRPGHRFAHLKTEIRARAAPGIDALDLVAKLHPTPAVAGTPRAAEIGRAHV